MGWIDARQASELSRILVSSLRRNGADAGDDDGYEGDPLYARAKLFLDTVRRKRESVVTTGGGSGRSRGNSMNPERGGSEDRFLGTPAASVTGGSRSTRAPIITAAAMTPSLFPPGREILLPEVASGGLSDAMLRDLFVETCFFARLGFLQPPSCLSCAYREATVEDRGRPRSKDEEDYERRKREQCSHPVVWRRDATVLLHPEKLGDSALVVATCRAVGAWMRGEERGGLLWNRVTKKLVKA